MATNVTATAIMILVVQLSPGEGEGFGVEDACELLEEEEVWTD